MAISVQGTPAQATAQSLTLPAHAAGDLIVIAAQRSGNATTIVVPSAGGTVPTWLTVEVGVNSNLHLSAHYCIATANNHTSGSWSNATNMVACVFRGTAALSLGAHTPGSGTSSTQVVYPALVLNAADGTSMGVRLGSRATGTASMRTVPEANWSFQVGTQPAGSTILSLHTRAALAANPGDDTVTFSSLSSAYRCVTLEIQEAPTRTATAALTVGAATLGGRALQVDLLTNLAAYYKLDEASGDAIDAVAGLNLTDTNTVAAATGKVSGCRDFESGNTEYFTRADHATFSAGDIDFTVAAWVQLESKGASRTILAKYDTGGSSREYWLQFSNGSDRFAFTVSSNGTTTTAVAADNLGSPALATWYHVVAWHDATNNVIGICVNAGTPNTAAHTTGVFDGTAPFMIGARAGAADLWDGLIDELGLWKNRVLTTAEREYLHNQGAGRPYSEFGGAVAGTYTGTAAVTVGHATLAATGTFTKPTYTGSSALTVGHATAAVSATFTKPTYTGTAALTPTHATLAASATFTKPTYAATASLAAGHAALAASGTFTAPTYTGTAALTWPRGAMDAGWALLAGTATATPPTYTGTGAAAVGPALLAGTGTFTTPAYTGQAALTSAAADLDAAGTFTTPAYTAAGAAVAGPVTLTAAGTFATPHYSATADVAAGPAVFLASATFAPGTHEAVASVTVGGTLFVGVATFVETVPQGGVSLAASLVYTPTPAGEVYATDASLDVYTGRLAKGGVQ